MRFEKLFIAKPYSEYVENGKIEFDRMMTNEPALLLRDNDILSFPDATFVKVEEMLPDGQYLPLPINNTEQLLAFLQDHPDTYNHFFFYGVDNENELNEFYPDDFEIYSDSESGDEGDEEVGYFPPEISYDVTAFPIAAEHYGYHVPPLSRKRAFPEIDESHDLKRRMFGGRSGWWDLGRWIHR